MCNFILKIKKEKIRLKFLKMMILMDENQKLLKN